MRFVTFFPFPGTIKHIKSYFCTLEWTQPNQPNQFIHLHKNLIVAWGFCGNFFPHTGEILSGFQKLKAGVSTDVDKSKENNHFVALVQYLLYIFSAVIPKTQQLADQRLNDF